jgi:P-type E1-E2 ATPase
MEEMIQQMMEINVPGLKPLHLTHLVLDFNGTLACDGKILPGVRERLEKLAQQLEIHVLTADTFGTVQEAMAGIPCRTMVIPDAAQAEAKAKHVHDLGRDGVVAIGNGRNDRLMLQNATLGIAVMQEEGAAPQALLAADVAVPNINCALDLLIQPLRLIATLRG